MSTDTDLHSLEFWNRPRSMHHETFRWLRANDPVSWNEPPEGLDPNLDNSQGFWSVVRHADIEYVSKTPELFSSAEGVFMDDFPQLENMLSFIVSDDPRHAEMRGIVSAAFTPKRIKKVEDDTRATVGEIIDGVAPLGEGDLCELVTKEVPGRIFATFFGIKDRDRIQYVMDAAEQMGAWSDPGYEHIGSPLEVFADASSKLSSMALELAGDRHENPGDDLLSAVVQAQDQGKSLTDEEVGVFFALLAGAGNDTTRHSMAHVLTLFQQHPDQLEYLMADFDNRVNDAINEVLRVEPPLMHFRRTTTQDTELGGKTIRHGEKLVLWYISGNRDESVFENPDTFDITRPVGQNPHQAFGGGGPHYCLGNQLGKQMLRSEIWEVYTRMKDLQVGEPTLMLSNFMNGVMTLPATWTPEKT